MLVSFRKWLGKSLIEKSLTWQKCSAAWESANKLISTKLSMVLEKLFFRSFYGSQRILLTKLNELCFDNLNDYWL